jgi:hypothetical protein
MLIAMTDTIIGAIIGAVAALLATIPAWLSERRKRKDAQAARQEDELKALQMIIDISSDIHVLDGPSMVSFPESAFQNIGELRKTILMAQGALPIDSQARPTVEMMQSVAGELRQSYRKLERPVGEPDEVNVTPEDFEYYVKAFQDRFAPLLKDVENRVRPTGENRI